MRGTNDHVPFGNRVEIKNLNSVRAMARAIEYEVARQTAAMVGGALSIPQETRTFDVTSGQTVLLRSKGDALDYRFMEDPDLPPLVLTDEYIARVRYGIFCLCWCTHFCVRLFVCVCGSVYVSVTAPPQ